jgi:hypothetical protein
MKTPKLGRRVMAAIGRQLRKLYADIIAEGVPERFAAILRRLDNPNTQDEPTPPAAPAASSEQVSRDDGNGIENGGETHASLGASPRALRWFAFRFARAALTELVPTEIAVA